MGIGKSTWISPWNLPLLAAWAKRSGFGSPPENIKKVIKRRLGNQLKFEEATNYKRDKKAKNTVSSGRNVRDHEFISRRTKPTKEQKKCHFDFRSSSMAWSILQNNNDIKTSLDVKIFFKVLCESLQSPKFDLHAGNAFGNPEINFFYYYLHY